MRPDLERKLAVEFIGMFIFMFTVGMATNTASAGALAPLAIGSALMVMVFAGGHISGAHFNPAVSLAFVLRRELPVSEAPVYLAMQVSGAIAGAWLAHLMFELPVIQVATTVRIGFGQWLAEATATFGLLLTIFGCLSGARAAIPYAVGRYITAAYWFTASTSFANPAVTVARALSDTFAGIAPGGIAAFVAAQFAGALLATMLAIWLWPARKVA